MLAGLVASLGLGCSNASGNQEPQAAGGDDGGGGINEGGELELTVEPDRLSFASLRKPALVALEDDGQSSIAWDLGFKGRDVFTNGGISGPGNSSAFGPLSAPTYLSDTAPEVPLMLQDRAGGAFLDWYDYAGEDHRLYSRYHVYGVRDGARLFKVQILSYYGEVLGAPVSALYRIRYAEVLEDGSGEVHELADIDATAGGTLAGDEQPGACLDFDTQETTPLTIAEAAESEAWHLCFLRGAIAVNGGLSGPRGVESVDLQAALTADETEAEIQQRTAASELALFEETDAAALQAETLDWRTDGVTTAFARRWLEPGTDPAELSDSVWFVLGSDGATKYLMKFESLSGNLGDSSATLRLRAKVVR